MDQYHPTNIRGTLGKHILTDGFQIVPDLEKSYGARLIDKNNGRMYIDCFSQFASQPLGWNDNYLKTQKQRMDKIAEVKIANSDMYTSEYARFVDTFGKVAEDFRNYFFIDGGALGVENALKCAFDWKAQKLGLSNDADVNNFNVVHLEEAFHGRTGYTMSMTNTDPDKIKWFPKFNWTRVLNPKIHEYYEEDSAIDVGERERMSIDQVEKALLDTSRPVAAIVLEPIQGEGGDNHFRQCYLQSLRELADKHEAMLIFDEVQTGFGTTGRWWAYQHFGVVPDMIAFGKKTQVCGFATTDRVHEVPDNVFRKSSRINSTWGGNLVDMVRSTIIIEAMLKNSLVQKADRVGIYLLEKLGTLGLKNLRGRGLMVAFDHDDRDAFFDKLSHKLLCLKCGEHSIRLRPPLCFSETDVEYVHRILKEALQS